MTSRAWHLLLSIVLLAGPLFTGCGTEIKTEIVLVSPSNFTIGGTVSGLSGTVTLQNNAQDDLAVHSNGSFTFATALPAGSTYVVSVRHQPTGQTCSIAQGTGMVSNGSITTAVVACVNSAASGKIGSSCVADVDCSGTNAFCMYGFCARACGAGAVSNCNDPLIADQGGVMGGIYACVPNVGGVGTISICLPNGSGDACTTSALCPRSGESCISSRCQYPQTPGGVTARTQPFCHRDSDCKADESCVTWMNRDTTDIRTDGICIWTGARAAGGASCTVASDCASYDCVDGTCRSLCMVDGDCAVGSKCSVSGLFSSMFAEYPTEYLGTCQPWSGSRATCSANANCTAGESCSSYVDLTSNDTNVGVFGACKTLPNAGGAAVGASCSQDSNCKSGRCELNVLTGLGYCTADCLGGDTDCAGGTSCRTVTLDKRDPETPADDLTAGKCVQTGLGATCSAHGVCAACIGDADCNAAQGVTCVGGFCRDAANRCEDPCRTCTGLGTQGDCPSGSTCSSVFIGGVDMNYCADNITGACVRADVGRKLAYEHGICGDAGSADPQQDLCYYYGNVTGLDVFACGSVCTAGVTTCADILTSGSNITTSCRDVFEFGTTGNAALFTPTQCAPDGAFTP